MANSLCSPFKSIASRGVRSTSVVSRQQPAPSRIGTNRQPVPSAPLRTPNQRCASIACGGMNFIYNTVFGKADASTVQDVKTIHELKALDIDKKEFDFASTKDQVLLVVNVASK
mmetsp:Transcript_8019/g.22995  ORF Transcript_8019/g.22995 Transcript_8019/m.22995 type:complete len:114 (-) Transcript_8019:422-763(-)